MSDFAAVQCCFANRLPLFQVRVYSVDASGYFDIDDPAR